MRHHRLLVVPFSILFCTGWSFFFWNWCNNNWLFERNFCLKFLGLVVMQFYNELTNKQNIAGSVTKTWKTKFTRSKLYKALPLIWWVSSLNELVWCIKSAFSSQYGDWVLYVCVSAGSAGRGAGGRPTASPSATWRPSPYPTGTIVSSQVGTPTLSWPFLSVFFSIDK